MAREHVGQMRQVAFAGADAAADFDGFFEGVVGDVVAAFDGVKDEDVEVLKLIEFGIGNVIRVSQVGAVAEAEAQDGQLVVHGPDGDDRRALDVERQAGDQMDVHLRRPGIGFLLEYVIVFFLERFKHVGFAEDGERTLLQVIERAYVIEAAGMVFMVVGQENGVEMGNLFAQHLLPEIGTGIDQESLSFKAHERRTAQALVPRIRRRTDLAVASDHRNPLRCPRSQKSKAVVHRQSNSGFNDFSDQVFVVGAFDAEVVFGVAEHFAALHSAFEEDLRFPPLIGGCEFGVEAVGESLEPGGPLGLDAFLYLVRAFCGGCAGTARVGEDVQEGRTDPLKQSVGLFEILVRFTGEAHDDVDAEEDARETFFRLFEDVADQLDLRFELFCRVTPVHPFERAVAARLDGDVEMGEELGARRNPAQDLFCQQVRFDGRNAVSFDAGYCVECLEQAEETFPRSLAEIARIDAREDYFHNALRCDFVRLGDEFGDRDVAALAAGKRDGAVGAVVVTAILDLQERAGPFAGRPGREDAFHRINLTGVTISALLPVEGELHQFSFLSGANDQVDAVDGEDLLRLELGVAAGYGNAGVRRRLVEPADEIAALLVGMFGYRAGVDHEAVDVRAGFDFFPAR